MSNITFQKYWYLGVFGFVGFYKFQFAIDYFQGQGALWDLLNLLWFFWFLYFLPNKK
ncbi:hypothetical protein [Aquimarina gracilis]|uniref:hypothetical protein n=1 Tax=Aquimarina gracilis TaxID=874422 RepID=UPI002B479A18|nr:hypothetical protein [Aquimarina gracilis]